MTTSPSSPIDVKHLIGGDWKSASDGAASSAARRT